MRRHTRSAAHVPVLPEAEAFPAFSQEIPRLGRWRAQPHAVLRPLYWWVQQMLARGFAVRDLHFDPVGRTAVLVYESPERLVSTVRRKEFARLAVDGLPSLIVEYVWRLGACGWATEIDGLVSLLRGLGLVQYARRAADCEAVLPDGVVEPDSVVRLGFWRLKELVGYGWRIEMLWPGACGGFVAMLPSGEMVTFPAAMPDDGTAAAALAGVLRRMDLRQYSALTQHAGLAAASEGRAAAGPAPSP